jgi:hypothetical protein
MENNGILEEKKKRLNLAIDGELDEQNEFLHHAV